MKARATLAVLAIVLAAANVQADKVSDHLERALALQKAGKYIQARAEIEKALEAVTPMAKAQIPKPEVKDRTYINYEHSFCVTRPEKDWQFVVLKPKGPGTGATYTLCQISHVKGENVQDDIVILYARDLKALLGARYNELKGQKMAFIRKAGRQMASAIKQLEDVQIVSQKELTLSGCPAVRTDYRARKGLKSMKCFTLQILRDNMMFTAMFVGTMKDDKVLTPAFEEIVNSIDLSPVPIPEK